jgi:hypothetical protein
MSTDKQVLTRGKEIEDVNNNAYRQLPIIRLYST